MLTTISVLTCLIFTITYPLYFWTSVQSPLKNKFHRFHIGLAAFLSGVLAAGLWWIKIPSGLWVLVAVWAGLFLLAAAVSWHKESLNPVLVSVPCFLGMWIFVKLSGLLADVGIPAALLALVGGLVLSGAMFAMNLGHWYLNVPGLPIFHLKNVVKTLGVILGIRLLLDGYLVVSAQVFYFGEQMTLYQYLLTLDGIFVWTALFFGTLFPAIALFFVYGTLKVKSTQSATGILYVIVIGVLIGEIASRYYFIKHGIPL